MDISIEKTLKLKDAVFIDVRSPKEFEEDHVPDAVNLYPVYAPQPKSVSFLNMFLTRKQIGKSVDF